MSTISVPLQRFSVTSSKPFETVLRDLEAQVGHPDIQAFIKTVAGAKDFNELEDFIQKAIGSSGLMEFARFNIGDVIRKERGQWPRIVRMVVGNPLILKQMVVHVPDAASYAPVTILIDERADGVRLSYDCMASLLAPYGNAEASKVAEKLDSRLESLLKSVS